jgi:hypothetical protein
MNDERSLYVEGTRYIGIVLRGIPTPVLYTPYVTFPSQSANSGLPLLCAAHRSHSSPRQRGSPPFPTTTAFPPLPLSPISLTLPTAPTLSAHTTQVLHILPQTTISRLCWPRFSTQPPPLFFPRFFFTLIGLDSVILSSSMLFFHSRDRDLSHGRATSHPCLLRTPPLT